MDDYSRFFYSFYVTDKGSFSASSFVCEYTVPAGVSETSQSQKFFPLAGKQQKEKGHILTSKSPVPLTVCPGGYMTRDFLACDLQAACHSPTYVSHCSLSLTSAPDEQKEKKGIANTVALFVCENFGQSIPYTLVCDFTVDCFDGSDENSCHHVTRDCSSYRCENGQCKERWTRCNRVDDCADGSDERYCNSYDSYAVFSAYSGLIRIDFTSHGTFQLTALHASNKCPETHFRCDENFEYCLPVYVLCNNIRDCPNGEDELQCENYTCPGFYRCRDSSVCVHVEQVCDGVAQCPRQDDELLCDATCPEECVCQGLAFVCPRPFPAHSYPPLRYLDASHSAMTFSDLANNTYLMWLSLAFCKMHTIHRQYLPNLRSLDLSHNEIETLSFDFVMVLPNLKEVVLSGNPLLSLVAQQSPVAHSALRTVDLSAVYLSFFNCNVLNNFPEIQSLNLSHNRVGLTIDKNGFTCVQYLKELDLRGTDIKHSSVSIFGTLTHIETIYSDNYRHCCSQVLPETVNKIFCIAPLSGFSSCTDLLRLDLHRVSMWIMAVLSSVGNVGYATKHFLLKAESNVHGSTMQTFMANLGAANFVMGLYLFVVVVADVHFRGDFLSHEVSWVRSVACKAAGFLAMASTEASAFFVFLLALDRFMSLCFCCVGFHKRSAWTACVVSWLCAIGLASVMPWLIGATASHRYTRMNICTAMPTLNEKVGGHKYSFSILVVLNNVLALGTAFCQTCVYLEVRSSYIFATANERSRDMVLARRVATVLVTDVICTLIVGVTGLMSSIGVTGVGDEVIVAVVIFVIPLKPSLNPLLHSFSMLTERKRMSQESRLLRLHETQCRARTTVRSAPKEAHRKPAQTPFGNKHDVFVYLKQSLESRCVLFQDIEELLTQYDDGNLRSHPKD
ncbi:G-protein coupled receptor GRL101-like [Littorina saxatilis]|uniref:G-protein coupled receptor GRL101-like n=1 Tax=Littorina saxatilis TaxID=31220 RepID=UPI0038B43D57